LVGIGRDSIVRHGFNHDTDDGTRQYPSLRAPETPRNARLLARVRRTSFATNALTRMPRHTNVRVGARS
jgi:hypothetical protein